MRSTWVVAGAALLAAASAAGGVVAASGSEEGTGTAQEPPPTTVVVEQGELSDMVALDGTLTYRSRPDGAPSSAINRASGTYTRLPEAGDRIGCGSELYRVDDEPVLLLCGTVPAYRALDIGAEGRDVRQLNRNLHRLGLDAGTPIDVDDTDFTWKTERAVRELQRTRGMDETGALDVEDTIVLPRSGRIAKVTGKLGGSARPGAEVLQATSSTLEVQVEIDASQQGAVKRGDRARITLPGNRSVTGRVDRLGRVARTAGKDDAAGSATIPAHIRLDDPDKARGLDRAPVRVEVTTKGVKGVLSVPVTALVGKAGGGFAVEVVRDGGRRDLAAVRLGLFDTAAGRVEVEGDLDAGDRVVVPGP